MTLDRRSLELGLRDSLPIAVAVLPFGAIVGLGAVQVGFGKLQSVLLSYLAYAGASQLAAFQLVRVGAPLLVVVVTAAMINLRFTMYSASMARYLARLPRFWRFSLVFFMTDQAFVLALHRFEADDPPASVRDYLLASWPLMWLGWAVSALLGALLGATLPPSWHLDFAVPLVFLALLASALRDRPKVLAAVVGGVAAVTLAGLPLNLGMLLGSLAGIAAGTLSAGAGSRRALARQGDE